jgi:hypothetical protein
LLLSYQVTKLTPPPQKKKNSIEKKKTQVILGHRINKALQWAKPSYLFWFSNGKEVHICNCMLILLCATTSIMIHTYLKEKASWYSQWRRSFFFSCAIDHPPLP